MGAPPVRLSRLLDSARDPGSVVAWRRDPLSGEDRPEHLGELLAQIAGLAVRLAEAPPGPWVLACEDGYEFAVGLLGLWRAGRAAIVPPNTQPGSFEPLVGRAVGLLSDRPEQTVSQQLSQGLRTLRPSAKLDPAASVTALRLDPEAEVLELFTSGTTGDGKVTVKRLRQLEDEVAHLEARFGEQLGDARVFCTASHQHLYGLLFKLLWPLCAGRAFQSDALLHAGELIPRMRASGRAVLASVPSHLRRLVEHEDARALRSSCIVTFSSGGALAEETADRWAEALGRAPLEIFGSTETGGVAWRIQEPGPERLAYRPFDAVQVERSPDDGRLALRSPFARSGAGGDAAEAEPLMLGDRIRLLDDGRFLLEGRADRVVKVGEKRLSLPAMEEQLRSHPFVSDVALLLLDAAGEARVGAVVVPSEAGAALLASEGRRALGSALAAHLAERWDRVLLPRAWRVVESLPEDAQGKVTVALLRAFFEAPPGSAAGRPESPRILAEHREVDAIERECSVPEDLAQLEGHFPMRPIVPGVAELQWAVELAEALSGPLEIEGVEALKFHRTLQPGARFRIRAEWTRSGLIGFRLWSEDEELASGRLLVASSSAARRGARRREDPPA